MNLRIIIAGSREFTNYQYLETKLLEILPKIQYEWAVGTSEMEIVSGEARGADGLGRRFGKEFGINVKPFPVTNEMWRDMSPPVWPKTNSKGEEYNALAGHKRNQAMADYANEDMMGIAIVFLDNTKCKGSKEMIRISKKEGMKTFRIDTVNDKIQEFN